jgi:transcription initiation factor IIE alpha subunit
MTECPKSPDDRSLHSKITEYFDAFPDEELTRDEIAIKFSVHPNTVDRVLRAVLAQGEIESVKIIRRRLKRPPFHELSEGTTTPVRGLRIAEKIPS